jgi:hypothetical protein
LTLPVPTLLGDFDDLGDFDVRGDHGEFIFIELLNLN